MAGTAHTRKVAMCLMAHPDDCEFLAAGTMTLLKQKGWEIHIVSMAPGDGGSAELGPEEIAAIRRAEGAKAAKLIGATYHCLESRDVYVMFDETTLRRAMTLTRQISPTLVVTHNLEDYMTDHDSAGQIGRAVAFGYAVPNACTGPMAKGARIPHLYYADPVSGVDRFGDPVPATTVVDISSVIATKTRMLKCHGSQRDWLLKHNGVDEYIGQMKRWSGERGRHIGVKYAEGFRQHKAFSHPTDNLLAKELGGAVHEGKWCG